MLMKRDKEGPRGTTEGQQPGLGSSPQALLQSNAQALSPLLASVAPSECKLEAAMYGQKPPHHAGLVPASLFNSHGLEQVTSCLCYSATTISKGRGRRARLAVGDPQTGCWCSPNTAVK